MTFLKAESQQEVNSTTLPELGTAEESVPRSLVPWNRDDNRSRYLGLRDSGFTIREALGLIGDAKSTLSHWRHDPVFLKLENEIPNRKRELALEYVGLEFVRNLRLILEKDYRVLKESLTHRFKTDKDGNKIPTGMDSQDFQYLLKMRPFYTPQQLQAIEQLFGRAGDTSKEVNWTDYVLTLSRTKEEIKVETRQRTPAQLSKLSEDLIEGEFTDGTP